MVAVNGDCNRQARVSLPHVRLFLTACYTLCRETISSKSTVLPRHRLSRMETENFPAKTRLILQILRALCQSILRAD